MKNTKNQVGALVSAIGIERHAAPAAGYRKSIDFKWFTENWLCSFKKLAHQDAGAPQPPTPNEPPAARPVPDDCKSIFHGPYPKLALFVQKAPRSESRPPIPPRAPAAGRATDDTLKP